jgi:anti-sigma factor RsiW
MKRPPVGRQHLDVRAILDYLEDRLDASARRNVEDHLAGSCSRCRELLHEVGRLTGAMLADRTPPVPAAMRERSLEVFGVRAEHPTSPRLVWQVARLLFDSRVSPIPHAARRAMGEARWLRFALDDHVLELETEPESGGSMTIRGCLASPDPALFRIEVAAGDESSIAWPDSAGRFSLERVPVGEASVTVQGPGQRWRLPAIDL